jgi:shikimate 5-dehydrogenase
MPLDSEALRLLPDDAYAYDIIYDPCPTRFLILAAERGLNTGDGGCMNLEQAVLGFGYATTEANGRDATRAAMEAAKADLDKG